MTKSLHSGQVGKVNLLHKADNSGKTEEDEGVDSSKQIHVAHKNYGSRLLQENVIE